MTSTRLTMIPRSISSDSNQCHARQVPSVQYRSHSALFYVYYLQSLCMTAYPTSRGDHYQIFYCNDPDSDIDVFIKHTFFDLLQATSMFLFYCTGHPVLHPSSRRYLTVWKSAASSCSLPFWVFEMRHYQHSFPFIFIYIMSVLI